MSAAGEKAQRVKVWDRFVRLAHWSVGLLVLGSFLTSEHDRLIPVHVRIGLAIGAVVVARVLWGFIGTAPARFRAFVRRPREVVDYARKLAAGRPPLHVSHNPLGGLMVVALLVVLAACVATGLVVYAGPEFQGPLTGLLSRHAAKGVKEVHEALTGVLGGLIGLHVAGVLFSSWREGQNLVLGMITGRKLAPTKQQASIAPRKKACTVRRAASATGLVLALALGMGASARAAGATSAELLREYEARARKDRPTFTGFSAEEGRRLYFSEHLQEGAKVSCASCHTPDPRGQGRTPAGKIVEPLAPAANPARFTDGAEVEKWFKRNCKQVLGRECTAEEKGNFVTWLNAV